MEFIVEISGNYFRPFQTSLYTTFISKIQEVWPPVLAPSLPQIFSGQQKWTQSESNHRFDNH